MRTKSHKQRGRTVLAAAIFFACTAPFGIAAHLTSELAGLGWHDDMDVAFSARHAYLALIALVSLACVVATLRGTRPADRGRRIAAIVDDLPFRGSGVRFIALSFVAQFAFFVVTQLGEGCPICGGDVLTGVVAAACAALLGALAVAFGKRRMLAIVGALVAYLAAEFFAPALHVGASRRSQTFRRSPRRAAFAFRYRPPPVSIARFAR